MLWSTLIKSAVLAGLVVVLPTGAPLAQVTPRLTEADMERARQDVQRALEQLTPEFIEKTRKEQLQQLEPLSATSGYTAPRMDALPVPLVKPNVDIASLSREFMERNPEILLQGLNLKPRLFVFITLAMPAESIKPLLAQAEQANATVVLRGFVNNSLKETTAALQKLMGQGRVGVLIDPEAFDRYGVRNAPSFVLTKAHSGSATPCLDKVCAQASGFALVSGDVSIEYALERIEQRAKEFKPEVQQFLTLIRG